MPINVTVDPKTGQQVFDAQVPQKFPKTPEQQREEQRRQTPSAMQQVQQNTALGGIEAISRVGTKALRDLTQEVLGNLPADEFSKLRVPGGVPRKPGAPDAPILGVFPPLPKVEVANPVEGFLANLIQTGAAWFLASRGVRGARGAAMRVPGAPAAVRAAAPVVQPLQAAAARATAAPGLRGFAGKVAVQSVKEAPASAIAAYGGFKPEEQRLSDHVLRWVEQQAGTPLHGALVDMVRSKPGDTASDARWKNAVEGLLIFDPAANAVVEGLGRAARAAVNLHKSRQAAQQAGKPAAEQVVDATAKQAEPPVTPTPEAAAGPAPQPKGKAKAVEVTETYLEMRRTPMWEKKGVEIQQGLPDPGDEVAKAEADYTQSFDDLEVAMARAANTVPDVAGPVAPEARGTELPSYSQVRENRVADIATDPQRFQFKAEGRLSKTGVSGSLKEAAEYDPLFGKIISVWRDPANGQLYVVNGHNRLDLARRSGRESILTWEIEAPTAEQARAIGAMENMAEGMGTPWDAAKIMRDMGMGIEQLRQRNINVRGPVAEKAIPLSRLPQELFDRGVTGKLDMAKAVALGSEPLDETVIRDVAAAAAKGKWSAEKILQAMQEAKFAQTEMPADGTLPGMEEWASKTSDFSVRADVRAEAYRLLREEMIALTSAARAGRKSILEAAGNVIDVAGSQTARDQAAQAAAVFNQVTGYVGPVRTLLDQMVEQVKGGKAVKKAVEDNLDALRSAIDEEINGPQLPLGAPAAAPSVPSAGTPAAAVSDEAIKELERAYPYKPYRGQTPLDAAEIRLTKVQDLLQATTEQIERLKTTGPEASDNAAVAQKNQRDWKRNLAKFTKQEAAIRQDLVTAQEAINRLKGAAAAPEPRVAVQPMGPAAAAAVEPPQPVIDIPPAAARKFNPEREQVAAESLYSWANSGMPGVRQPVASIDEALALVRAKNQILDPDAIPSLDMDAARNDKAMGRTTPATEAVGRAYRQFYEVPEARAQLTSEQVSPLDPDAVRRAREVLPEELPDSYRVDPDVTAAVKDVMVNEVRRIAGNDVAVKFTDGMVFKQGTEAHGTQGKVRRIGGGYNLDFKSSIEGDPIKEVIDFHEMSLLPFKEATVVDYTKNKLNVAAHEAFHVLQLRSMTSAQLKVMDTMFAKLKLYFAAKNQEGRAAGRADRPIEQAAQAFESYADAAREGVSPGAVMLGVTPDDIKFFNEIKPDDPIGKAIGGAGKAILDGIALVDDMFNYVERLYNAFRGRGWTSIRDIFAQAQAGELQKQAKDLGSVLDVIGVAENQEKEWARRIRELDKQGVPGLKPMVEYARDERLLSEQSFRLTREEPAGPLPVDPPPGPENSDDWVRRFARQLEVNRQALLNGDVTMEDLMANSFQKVQSPSGRTIYTAKREDLVDGLNAMSKVLPDRPTESGIPVFSPEDLRRMNQDWFTRHGEDGEAIMAGLKSLTRGFDEYQQGALNRAMAFADKKQVEAAQEAALWLNSANFEGVNETERLARLVTAAESSRAAHQAVMRVTRRWGQLGLEMQVPRDYDIPPNQNVKDAEIPEAPVQPDVSPVAAPVGEQIDVEAEIKTELEVEQAKPIEETLTNKLDPELTDAVNGGEVTPKAAAAADALAQSLVSIAADSKARTKFWRSFDDTRSFTPNALLMLRTSNLISSGVTSMTNVTNGLLNLARLPLQQAAGAALQGELKRSMYSLMMFQQYWGNLTNAMRVAGHAFKAGQSLFNLENSSVDYLSRIAKQEAQGELLQGPEQMTGWTVNTMDMGEEYARKPIGQLANHLWRFLGTGGTRIALTIDTFNSTLAGYAYEHVRHLPRGMELAVERGMKDMSPEAWKWAQQYADARTQESIKDVVLNGKNLADVHMDSPRAQAFMDAVNFTDKIWADLEPRTYGEGARIGMARGLEGTELQDFAQKYVDDGLAMDKVANFFMTTPVGRLGSLPGEAMDTLASARYVGPVFKFLQPFVRVPNNIIKSAARNTPAAAFVDTFWRDITSEDAFTRDRALGEVATGSAVLAMATMASAMGYIRFNGGGPLDPAAKQKWTEVEGRMPYSFQTWSDEEGRWSQPISMRAMEPFATVFGAIGDYADIAMSLPTEARNRLGGSLVLTLARMSTSGVLSKSYFQGFTEMYEAFFNPSKVLTGPNQRNAMARYMSRIAASMVPYSSALRAGRREVDPVSRTVSPSDVGGLMGFFQETLDEVRNAVPGWSSDLPARRDFINGQPILTTGILGSEQLPAEMPWLQSLMQYTPMAAMQVGRQPRGPVHEEMARLHGKGTSFLGPRAADFGAEMRLTPAELEQYILTFATAKDEFGRTFEQSAIELINSQQYQSWPIDGPSSRFVSLRAAALQDEIQRYKELAKVIYKETTPKGQLILQEEAATEADKGEKNYLRRYGGGTPAPQQGGVQSWSITPGNR